MTSSLCEVRPGAYYDSVVLMQLQRSLSELDGVEDAGVVMATPANLTLLEANDLPADPSAGPDDLLIVVKAADETTAKGALAQVDDLLARRRGQSQQAFRPKSLDTALRLLADARWVLISVPGRFAAGVTRQALEAGRHVFLYSDNVALEDEIDLKQLAAQKGLLLMGPDCGTAIVGGVGLGFANRVRPGNVGLVAASGTGLQAATVRLHQLGAGISQGIGTGGRDLSGAIGAVTMRQGLTLLGQDQATDVIVLISKPPEPEVAAGLLSTAAQLDKPVVVYFIGLPTAARRLGNLHFAASLDDAAELAAQLALKPGAREEASERTEAIPRLAGYVRGLFSGGTLAYEFLLGLQTILSPLYANISVGASRALQDVNHSVAHTIVDMGDDSFTQGRLHPMMDNDLRLRRLRQEADDLEVGLILLDVVLGQGAHPDPASELAPAIEDILAAARSAGRTLEIAALVVGTDEDPQDVDSQAERLAAAGAKVHRTLETLILRVLRGVHPVEAVDAVPVDPVALMAPVAAVNVGLELLYDSLVEQGAKAVHVDWRPPAGGNERLMALLAKMKAAQA